MRARLFVAAAVAFTLAMLVFTALWTRHAYNLEPAPDPAAAAPLLLERLDVASRPNRSAVREALTVAADARANQRMIDRINRQQAAIVARQEARQEARQAARAEAQTVIPPEDTSTPGNTANVSPFSPTSAEEVLAWLPDPWEALARCESGGNLTSVNPAGYYGLFQFSLSTWASVGGSGLPSEASAAEQLMRAQTLQARSGWGPWPVCGAGL